MSKIPTAEEWLKKLYAVESSSEVALGGKQLTDKLIEFAKLHCEAQLKAIVINVEQKQVPYTEDYEIDYNSIINAYPPTNIE